MGHTAKERLIDAAFALYDERGFEHTTVDDIAERAGVGRTTFFRNFRSKEQVIFPDHDRLLTAIGERLWASTPDTAVVAVSEAARLVLLHYLDEGDLARRRYALTRTVPALRDRERAGIQQYERLFAEFIHRWMGGGPDTALRAELMANAVVSAHNHVLRRWLRRDTVSPEAEFDAAMTEVAELFAPAPRRLGPGAGARTDSRADAGADSGADSGPGTAVVLLRTDKDLGTLRREIQRLLD